MHISRQGLVMWLFLHHSEKMHFFLKHLHLLKRSKQLAARTVFTETFYSQSNLFILFCTLVDNVCILICVACSFDAIAFLSLLPVHVAKRLIMQCPCRIHGTNVLLCYQHHFWRHLFYFVQVLSLAHTSLNSINVAWLGKAVNLKRFSLRDVNLSNIPYGIRKAKCRLQFYCCLPFQTFSKNMFAPWQI